MSVASVIGYLLSGNSGNNPNAIGYTTTLPCIQSAPIASNTSLIAVNNAVIPKGKWLVGGTIGLLTEINTNRIDDYILTIERNNVPVLSIAESASYNSTNCNLPSLIFESDGTATFKLSLIATTSAGNWQNRADGASNFITLIKIAG